MNDVIRDFLAQKRVAVIGVSRSGQDVGAGICKRLKANGYQVWGVNPNGGEVHGQPLQRSVADIPGGVDAAVVVTAPAATLDAVKQCEAAGVRRVWIHDNTLLPGSASPAALEFAGAHHMAVIPNGCPMMHVNADPVHACLGWALRACHRIDQPM